MTSHSTRIINSLAFVCALATAAPAYAHHEAIFGPQSSAALTWPDFLSVQVFDVQRGKGDEKTHTTTTVFSGGVTPFRAPVSLAFGPSPDGRALYYLSYNGEIHAIADH